MRTTATSMARVLPGATTRRPKLPPTGNTGNSKRTHTTQCGADGKAMAPGPGSVLFVACTARKSRGTAVPAQADSQDSLNHIFSHGFVGGCNTHPALASPFALRTASMAWWPPPPPPDTNRSAMLMARVQGPRVGNTEARKTSGPGDKRVAAASCAGVTTPTAPGKNFVSRETVWLLCTHQTPETFCWCIDSSSL